MLVKLVAGPNTADFLDEISAFPNSRHDDCVDALSGAHHGLGRRGSTTIRAFVAQGSIYDRAPGGPGNYYYPWR